jgi:methylmalonyl-CoA/ethylmalonyl-CoA epimerase
MLGGLNHLAIAVKDAKKAAKIDDAAAGAEISAALPREFSDLLVEIEQA